MMNQQFIQGNLQAVFDALYAMGVIDPVLRMDWADLNKEIARNPRPVFEAVKNINACGSDNKKLIEKMSDMDQTILSYIAMEVAREYAEFQDRKALH